MALDGATRVSYSGISPSNADGDKRNRIRVIRKFYYRFAFTYRFSFWGGAGRRDARGARKK